MQLTPTEYLELIENLHYVKSAGFKIMVVNGHFSVWKLYDIRLHMHSKFTLLVIFYEIASIPFGYNYFQV